MVSKGLIYFRHTEVILVIISQFYNSLIGAANVTPCVAIVTPVSKLQTPLKFEEKTKLVV